MHMDRGRLFRGWYIVGAVHVLLAPNCAWMLAKNAPNE